MDQMRNWGAVSSHGLDRRPLVRSHAWNDNQETRLKTDEMTRPRAHPLLVAPKHAQCGVKIVGMMSHYSFWHVDLMARVSVENCFFKDLVDLGSSIGGGLIPRRFFQICLLPALWLCGCSNMKMLQ